MTHSFARRNSFKWLISLSFQIQKAKQITFSFTCLNSKHHYPHHHPPSPILWFPGLATILEWLTDPTDSRFFSLSVSPSVMSMRSLQVQACSFSTSLYTRLQMLRRHSCQEFDFSDMTLFYNASMCRLLIYLTNKKITVLWHFCTAIYHFCCSSGQRIVELPSVYFTLTF